MGEAIAILSSFNIKPCKIWVGEFSRIRQKYLEELICTATMPNDWIVMIDIDEFHEYPNGLRELIYECEESHYDCVMGRFLDRQALAERLIPYNPGRSLWEQYPLTTRFSEEKLKTPSDKIMLKKAYVPFVLGHHHPDLKKIKNVSIYPQQLNVHHFKWRAGVLKKLSERVQLLKRLEYDWWVQSQRAINYFEEMEK